MRKLLMTIAALVCLVVPGVSDVFETHVLLNQGLSFKGPVQAASGLLDSVLYNSKFVYCEGASQVTFTVQCAHATVTAATAAAQWKLYYADDSSTVYSPWDSTAVLGTGGTHATSYIHDNIAHITVLGRVINGTGASDVWPRGRTRRIVVTPFARDSLAGFSNPRTILPKYLALKFALNDPDSTNCDSCKVIATVFREVNRP